MSTSTVSNTSPLRNHCLLDERTVRVGRGDEPLPRRNLPQRVSYLTDALLRLTRSMSLALIVLNKATGMLLGHPPARYICFAVCCEEGEDPTGVCLRKGEGLIVLSYIPP